MSMDMIEETCFRMTESTGEVAPAMDVIVMRGIMVAGGEEQVVAVRNRQESTGCFILLQYLLEQLLMSW